MPGSPDPQSGWSSAGGSSPGAGSVWQYTGDGSGGSGRMSVRLRRLIFGALTLGVAGLIVVILLLWNITRVPPAEVLAYGISKYHNGQLFPENTLGHEDALAFLTLEKRHPAQFSVTVPDDQLSGNDFLQPLQIQIPGKNLIVFCSLQGRVAASSDDADLEAQLYPIDASGDDTTGLISVPVLLDKLQQTQARHILLLIDVSRQARNWELGLLANDWVAQLRQQLSDNPRPNLCVLCSAGPLQTSWINPAPETPAEASPAAAPDQPVQPAQLSIFTQCVLNGLQGDADGWSREVLPAREGEEPRERFLERKWTRDQRVDTDELHAYVAHHVLEQVIAQQGLEIVQNVIKLGDQKFDVATVAPPVASQAPPPVESGEAAAATAAKEKKPAAAPKPKPGTKPATGPAPLDLKLVEAVLSSPMEDPKVLEPLQASLKGPLVERQARQKQAVDWLLQQAVAEPGERMVYHLAPIDREIETASKSPDFLFLERALAWEQTEQSRTAWPSKRIRRALQGRQQLAYWQKQSGALPVSAQQELTAGIQAQIAAERWMKFAPQFEAAERETERWQDETQRRLQAVTQNASQLQQAEKLIADWNGRLPQLAHWAADRSESGHAPENWKSWQTLARRQLADSRPDDDVDLVAKGLPDLNAQNLYRLSHGVQRLAAALQQPQSQTADLQRSIEEVKSLAVPLEGQQPPAAAMINARQAGLWQGFWAIETLHTLGTPAADERRLWKLWGDLVNAAEAAEAPLEDLDLRRQRALLGAAIRRAWPSTTGNAGPAAESNIPANVAESSELAALWKRLTGLEHLSQPALSIIQPDQFSAGAATSAEPEIASTIQTTRKQRGARGEARFRVTFPAEEGSQRTARRLTFLGPAEIVEIARADAAGTVAVDFEIEPEATAVDFVVAFPAEMLEKPRFLLVLKEISSAQNGRELPLDIQALQFKPPFDESLWKIVFRTDKGAEVYHKPIEAGCKVPLLPASVASLIPHLSYPPQAEYQSAQVSVLRITPEGPVPLFAPITIAELRQSGGEVPLLFPLPAPPAAGTPAPAPAGPPGGDVSDGLLFSITPQGKPTPVTYRVQWDFYSPSAFIQEPRAAFDWPRVVIDLTRTPLSNLQVHPLLETSVQAQLAASPNLPVRLVDPPVFWEAGDVTARQLTVELNEEEARQMQSAAQLSLSIASLPHAYRWNVWPRERRIELVGGSHVRIARPAGAILFLREGSHLAVFRQAESKPEDVALKIEVDSLLLDYQNEAAGSWLLTLEREDPRLPQGTPNRLKEWKLKSALEKPVQLVLADKGLWQLTSAVHDFTLGLQTQGLQGKFLFRARLDRPDGQFVAKDEVVIAFDDSPPPLPRFRDVPDSHMTERDLAVDLEFDDPQSGIFKLDYGVDRNGDGKLTDDEKGKPLLEPERRARITIPKTQLAGTSGKLALLAVATNGAGLTSVGKSSDILFMLPKSATTGSLLVTVNKFAQEAKWTLEGPTPVTKTFKFGTAQYLFEGLDPGKYQIKVEGSRWGGTADAMVEIKKETPVEVDMKSK